MYTLVHCHKHAHETLPMRAWNGWFVATPCWWVARDWVAWQMRSARLRVGSDVSICTMEIGWHDRRDQHGCVLDRMYLYVPIWKSELLRMGGMIDEVSTVACWVGCVYMHNRDWVAWQMRFAWLRVRSDVSICTNSGLWMVEKQAGNVWIVELWNECELCYELYWVMNCDYGWFIDSCVGDL